MVKVRVLGVPTLALSGLWVSSLVATQVFAWQHGYHQSLGPAWGVWDGTPLYAPWAFLGWLWQWAPVLSLRHCWLPLGLGGGLSLLTAYLCCCAVRPRPIQARWARWWDMKKAQVLSPAGVVLGYWRGQTLRYGGDMHTVMVAPTGTKKTTSVVIPTMLEWQHSLIVNDPKNELFPLTAGYRSQFSRLISLNPTSPLSDRFDPLGQIRIGTEHEVRDLTLVCDMLASPEMEASTSEVGQHFRDLTNMALMAGITHGLYSGEATTLKELDTLFQNEDTFDELLVRMIGTAHTPDGPHPVVVRGVSILKKLADKELSGVCSTIARALQWTIDPLAARMIESSDFTLHDLRDDARPMTVYLTIPYSDQERLRALYRLIVRQMLDYMTQDVRPHTHRMLIILDEAQTLQRMAAIPSVLQFGRGYGLHLMVIVPSLREMERLYGPQHTFIESAHARLVYAPNDPTVAAQFSRMGGEYQEIVRGKEWRHEKLLTETTLMHLPSHKGVLFLGNGGFPAIVEKAPYWENTTWAARAALPAP